MLERGRLGLVVPEQDKYTRTSFLGNICLLALSTLLAPGVKSLRAVYFLGPASRCAYAQWTLWGNGYSSNHRRRASRGLMSRSVPTPCAVICRRCRFLGEAVCMRLVQIKCPQMIGAARLLRRMTLRISPYYFVPLLRWKNHQPIDHHLFRKNIRCRVG